MENRGDASTNMIRGTSNIHLTAQVPSDSNYGHYDLCPLEQAGLILDTMGSFGQARVIMDTMAH